MWKQKRGFFVLFFIGVGLLKRAPPKTLVGQEWTLQELKS